MYEYLEIYTDIILTLTMIITILVIILCFFFLFEQQIKFLFSMIFTRNEEDVPEAEDEEASEPMRIRRKKN